MLKLISLIFGLSLLVSYQTAQAAIISNVAVCAAECNSESVGIVSHGKAFVGIIYYAPATT